MKTLLLCVFLSAATYSSSIKCRQCIDGGFDMRSAKSSAFDKICTGEEELDSVKCDSGTLGCYGMVTAKEILGAKVSAGVYGCLGYGAVASELACAALNSTDIGITVGCTVCFTDDCNKPFEVDIPPIMCYRCLEEVLTNSTNSTTESLTKSTGIQNICRPRVENQLSHDDLAPCGGDVSDCIKWTLDSPDGTSFGVVRGCLGDVAPFPEELQVPTTADACKLANEASVNYDGEVWPTHCYTCDDDGCNSAVTAYTSMLPVALAGLLGKFIL